ncbi:phage tail domain-containing protein [Enterococcus sp. LJL99]
MSMMSMDNGLVKKTWEDFGLRPLKDHENPSQSDYKALTLKIPGQSQNLYFGSEIQGKPQIVINFKKMVKEEYEINEIVDRVNLFLFDEFKQPRFLKVIFDYDPFKYVWLQVANGFTIDRSSIMNGFSIPFMQNDDNRYSVEEVNDVKWGSVVIDFRANYKLGHEGSGAVDLPVIGTTSFYPTLDGYAVQPFIILQGKADTISITSGASVIRHSSFNGKLEIDTENYIAYVNGTETMLERFDEFYLVPNQRVYITGTGLDLKATMHYRWKYI